MVGSDIEMFKFNSQNSQRNGLLDPNRGEISLATGNQFVDGSAIIVYLGYFGGQIMHITNYLWKKWRFAGSSQFPWTFWAFFHRFGRVNFKQQPHNEFSDKV